MSRRPTFIWLAVSTLIALAAALSVPAFAQEDLTAEQYEALSHALDMSIEEIRALGLSPNELQVLVDGFTEETVVVGSRGQPRTVTSGIVQVRLYRPRPSTRFLQQAGVARLPRLDDWTAWNADEMTGGQVPAEQRTRVRPPGAALLKQGRTSERASAERRDRA